MDSNGATQMLYNDSNISDPRVGGVRIGDRVRWTSAAGVLRGEVVNMCLALTSAGTLAPWLDIKYTNFRGLVKTVNASFNAGVSLNIK